MLPYALQIEKGAKPLDGYEQTLEAERRHLARILQIAESQLREAEREDARQGESLTESRREMREQAAQMFGSLWGSESFEELANLNQFAQPLNVRETTGKMRLRRIQALRGMLEAPYFARLDFRFDDGDAERVYIGRATLKDDLTHEIYIHDWRSPIASVFYRFGTGRVYYDAPGGRIHGTVALKRQFEIRGGQLIYFFDAEAEVQDQLLRGMLSQNASPRMKAIVETIQRDQDLAIRDTEHELLMVQGAAGSGKSSIALSRVAYLMYEGLSNPLSANDILILSPNHLFERYIRGVLPELNEMSVATETLEQLLSKTLGGIGIETRGERFERLSLADSDRPIARDSMRFKTSEAFREVLDRFLKVIPRRHIGFQDVYYGGRIVATRQQLKHRALRGGMEPLGIRLRKMASSLWDGIHTRKPTRMAKLIRYARRDPRHATELEACARGYSILESAILARQIRAFTRLDPRALYGALVSDERAFRRLADGLTLPESLRDILLSTKCALSAPVLPLEDATAIAYLALAMEGSTRFARIRQVMVDEAQDYDPVQYSVLNRLFPRARFTVLGDVNQALEWNVDRTLYETITATLNRRSARLVELTKSFRCTREILEFSLKYLQNPGSIESFNRSGDLPAEHRAKDPAALIRLIAAETAVCREKNLKSVALIARTARDARRWHEPLRKALPGIGLIDSDTAGETTGAFVIPLQLSKGLEFDAVLVLDADRYEAAGERRLLYVACTRALHRLNLYSLTGKTEGGQNA